MQNITWDDRDGFKMIVLDYFIIANDPDRETLQKIYRQAVKLNETVWLSEQFKINSDILKD